MAEAVDLFADAVHISVMPFGCTLQFGVSRPMSMSMTAGDITPGPVPSDRIATVRLTAELVKGLTFLMRENILRYEQSIGARIELSPEVMEPILLGSSRERWDKLWEYTP